MTNKKNVLFFCKLKMIINVDINKYIIKTKKIIFRKLHYKDQKSLAIYLMVENPFHVS